MHPLSVVDRHWITPGLDPITLILLFTAFATAVIATLRRPAFGAAILAGVAPFDFAHAILGTTVGFPKAALLGVIVGLIARRGSSRSINWSQLLHRAVGFSAILITIAFSAIAAVDRHAVLRELLKWSEYLLIFGCAYAAAKLDDDSSPIAWGIALSTGIVCVSALAEELIGAPSGLWIASTPVPRIAGFLEGPNQLGAFLEINIGALAALQIAASSRMRAILLGVAAITLFLTFSRGAYFGLGVIAIVLVAVERRRALAAVLPVAIGIGVGLISWVALLGAVRLSGVKAFAESLTRTGGAYAGGVGNRSELWRAALFFFRTHPLFGIGAGNFELRLSDAGVYGVRTHANSWYLQSLAEGGISLFGATLFFLYTILNALRKKLRSSPWTLAAFAATIALALHQVVDYLVFFPKVAEPWLVLVALGIAASDRAPCDS